MSIKKGFKIKKDLKIKIFPKMNLCQKYALTKKGRLASATTIVAVRYHNGVVLGADSRTIASQFGRIISDTTLKLLRIGDRIAIGYSGDTDFLVDLERYFQVNYHPMMTTEEVAGHVTTEMENYVEANETDIAVLVVGVSVEANANPVSIIKIKNDSQGNIENTVVQGRYAAVGSGEYFVQSYLNIRKWQRYPLDLVNVGERKNIVFETLKHVVRTGDWGTGGRLRAISFQITDHGEVDVQQFSEIQPIGSGDSAVEYVPDVNYIGI